MRGLLYLRHAVILPGLLAGACTTGRPATPHPAGPAALAPSSPTHTRGAPPPKRPVAHRETEEATSYDDDAFAPCTAVMFSDHPPLKNLERFAANGKYGFRRPDGDVVIEPRFNFAYEFNPFGLAGAVEDGMFIFIDVSGRTLARAFPYDNGPDYFSEKRARIIDNTKIGFIDAKGTIVIEPRFDRATPFCHRRSRVCRGCDAKSSKPTDRWGVIDRLGRVVVPIVYERIEVEPSFIIVTRNGTSRRLDIDGRAPSP